MAYDKFYGKRNRRFNDDADYDDYSDNWRRPKTMTIHKRNEKKIKNALRANNIQMLMDEDDY